MTYGIERIVLPATVLMLAFTCTSCATTGAWYHQSEDGVSSLYVASIYSGKARKIKSALVNNNDKNGWKCLPKESGDGSIAAGQLIILWLPRSELQPCTVFLPTEMTLSFIQGDDLKARVSSSLPSALPEEWLDCPKSISIEKLGSGVLPEIMKSGDRKAWYADQQAACEEKVTAEMAGLPDTAKQKKLDEAKKTCARPNLDDELREHKFDSNKRASVLDCTPFEAARPQNTSR